MLCACHRRRHALTRPHAARGATPVGYRRDQPTMCQACQARGALIWCRNKERGARQALIHPLRVVPPLRAYCLDVHQSMSGLQRVWPKNVLHCGVFAAYVQVRTCYGDIADTVHWWMRHDDVRNWSNKGLQVKRQPPQRLQVIQTPSMGCGGKMSLLLLL